ncbi:MAG: TIR domain-containing protein, partial [Leptolyngbya sp. SIO4C5]|nr:TIR domain-containing protein [Leptolyngbya sp. SIO4C5]
MAGVTIYISYSRKDEEWCQKLLLLLQPLKRLGLIHIRHDQEIETGTNWRDYYENAFNEAKIAILLISPDFLNS